MKKMYMKKWVSFFLLVIFVSGSVPVRAADERTAAEPPAAEDYAGFVDPFVGTAVDNGQLFPGAVAPYGLVKLSPDTYPHSTDDHAGYDYNKTMIQGFSHTRVEGVGGQGSGGDILVTPSYVDFTARPTADRRAMAYDHGNESAAPGYYAVDLRAKTPGGADDGSMGVIRAEMTADTRTGYHRYTFPKQGKVSLGFDLNYTYHGTDVRDAELTVKNEASATTLSGRFSGRNVSGHGLYTLYFYIETSKPSSEIKTWNGSALGDGLLLSGNDLGALLYFNVAEGETIETKVSVSPVSAEQAKRDMYAEIPWDGATFESVRENARAKWNDVLGKIKIKSSAQSDPTGELKSLFYTQLYHMFMTPINATSTDGTFRATDTNVYAATDYTHYDSWTLWDDFRKYPMIGLVYPEAYKDIIRSLANTMTYGIGTWGIGTQTVPTVRTEHAVALLADGIAKGFTDIDNLIPAYQKAKAIADEAVTPAVENLGYINGRLDRTVEFSYDDWAISLLADHLGNAADSERYLNRSFFYKNLYRPDAVTVNAGQANEQKIGLLWPRNANGGYLNANAEQYGATSLYQGTIWQYTWWDSNDVKGLMDLMGGPEKTRTALSYLYGEQAPDDGRRMLHSNANEIDLHTPYLFNFAGKPSDTQYWVRQIYTKETWNRYSGTGEFNPPIYAKAYRLAPEGYLRTMDDDAGTMSAMFVAAAMGLFPMTPGDTTFQIGSPFFEELSLDVGAGRTFVVKANNVSADNFYIQSAALNGDAHNRTWLDYSEIIRGGTLELDMGAAPSDWVEDGLLAPSASETAGTALFDKTDALSYSTFVMKESAANDGTVGNKIVIRAAEGVALNAEPGEDLIARGKVSVGNVPLGLAARAILTGGAIEISFAGQAAEHQLRHSIGNLSVTLGESLLGGTTSKYAVRADIKVLFDDYRIDFDKTRINESAANDGTLPDTAAVTLTGGAVWNAAAGEDLVAAGKAEAFGLPEGLGLAITATGPATAILSFTGAAANHRFDTDDAVIRFHDTAFAGGVSAANVTNSSFGGMSSLILDFFEPMTDTLGAIIREAESVDANRYVRYSYSLLQNAVAAAKDVMGDMSATEVQYQAAYDAVHNAMLALTRRDDGFDRLEGEASDSWSANGLKNESINLGGVTNGSWVGYTGRNFGGGGVQAVTVRYDNNGNRCAADASLEIRLGSANGKLIQTIALPQTNANGWGTYATVTVPLEEPSGLAGEQDVYFVFKGTTGGQAPTGGVREFICNLDAVSFVPSGSYGRHEGEAFDAWSGGRMGIETGASGGNLGGSYDGAWIAFYDMKFTGEGLRIINARYASSWDCPPEARLELRKYSPTGELIGTVALPNTGGSWGDYATATVTLAEPFVGTCDVFMVMVGAEGFPYTCNFDYLELLEQEPVRSAYDRLEAENRDNWSGGALKTETSTDDGGQSLVNLGATYDGAWLRYAAIDFGENGPSKFAVRYANNAARCAADAALELRLGDENGPLLRTMPIPATGGNWNAYRVAEFDLTAVSAQLTGVRDVTIVLKGTVTGSNPYIANFDYFEFTKSSPDADQYGQPVLTVSGNPISALSEAAGAQLNAAVTVKRADGGHTALFVALYDAKGRLANLRSVTEQLEPGAENTLAVDMTIPASTEGLLLRCFLWDADTLAPLTTAFDAK